MAAKKRKKPNTIKVIELLVEIPSNPPKNFWAKESKMAKVLFERFGEEKIVGLKLDKKYPSLAYVAALSDLETRINDFWQKKKVTDSFKTKETKEIVLVENKIGEDKIIVRRPRTVRDFLKNK